MPIYSGSLRAAFILLAVALCACSGGESKPDASASKITHEIDANTLKNDFFGVTVTKPESWSALNKEQMDALIGAGNDVAYAGNEDLKRAANASAKRTFPVFVLFMHELGSPVPVNPNVTCITEDASLMPGVRTGSDYFFHAKNLMVQTGLAYEFSDEYTQRTIDGFTFDAMDVVLTINGKATKQTYYATRHGNYVVTLIESYGADEYKSATSQIIDSIKFDW